MVKWGMDTDIERLLAGARERLDGWKTLCEMAPQLTLAVAALRGELDAAESDIKRCDAIKPTRDDDEAILRRIDATATIRRIAAALGFS